MSNATSKNAQRAKLMQALGECILSWSVLEHNLAILFARLNSPSKNSIQIITSVNSLEVRLGMINAVAEATLASEDDLAEWRKLHAAIRRKAKKRNEVAHSTLFESPDSLFLVPHFKLNANTNPKLSAKDLYERIDSFNALTQEVRSFASRSAANAQEQGG